MVDSRATSLVNSGCASVPGIDEAGVAGQREGGDGSQMLHAATSKLRAHVLAIQLGKQAAKTGAPFKGRPIVDCINDLPAIIRALDSAEFEIEAAFENYEERASAMTQSAFYKHLRYRRSR